MNKLDWSTKVLPVTLKWEGGKVNNPADPGGRTNEGVTQKTYDSYRAKKGQATQSVYNMTNAERDDIYASMYFVPIGGLSLSAGRCMVKFDAAVNSGPARATALEKSIHPVDELSYIKMFTDARMTFLQHLSTWRTFGKGWGSRCGSVEAAAIKLANVTPEAATAIISTQSSVSKVEAKKRRVNAVTSSAAGGVVAPASISADPGHPFIVMGAIVLLVAVIVAGMLIVAKSHEDRAIALKNALGPA